MDEGNYTVKLEPNGKHSDPIWILFAVLTARKVGGTKERGQEGAAKRKVDWGEVE